MSAGAWEATLLLLKDEVVGKADAAPPMQVASQAQAHGLAIEDNRLYGREGGFVADIEDDGTLGNLEMFRGDRAIRPAP